jgi:hypothetical protein
LDLRYPIGQFQKADFSKEILGSRLADIRFLPGLLEKAIENLDAFQLQTPYREGGWNLIQVVHHLADSHLNAYFRLKLILTENNPVIRPYDENAWALTGEIAVVPINTSLTILYGIHEKMYTLFNAATAKDWERSWYHPESQLTSTLWDLLGKYAWHGKHHVAHITALREIKGW